MANITSQTIRGTLQDGLNGLFGREYNMIPDRYTEVFDVRTSTRAFEEHLGLSGFGNARVKPKGTNTQQLSTRQQFKARFEHLTISAFFSMESEAMEDGRYGSQTAGYVRALAASLKETKEIFAFSVINQAYNASAPAGDGKAILATDHPLARGTWSNILGNAGVELTTESLQALLVMLPQILSDSGQHAGIRADCLMVPNDLEFVAAEILTSVNRAGTMNNDINALRTLNSVPNGVKVSEFLVNPNRWFIKTNSPEGLVHYVRKAVENKMEGDFLSDDARFKSTERYSNGIIDPRGMAAPPIS